MSLFPGFRSEHVDVGGVRIRAAIGPARDAPAVLLLHGYPDPRSGTKCAGWPGASTWSRRRPVRDRGTPPTSGDHALLERVMDADQVASCVASATSASP